MARLSTPNSASAQAVSAVLLKHVPTYIGKATVQNPSATFVRSSGDIASLRDIVGDNPTIHVEGDAGPEALQAVLNALGAETYHIDEVEIETPQVNQNYRPPLESHTMSATCGEEPLIDALEAVCDELDVVIAHCSQANSTLLKLTDKCAGRRCIVKELTEHAQAAEKLKQAVSSTTNRIRDQVLSIPVERRLAVEAEQAELRNLAEKTGNVSATNDSKIQTYRDLGNHGDGDSGDSVDVHSAQPGLFDIFPEDANGYHCCPVCEFRAAQVKTVNKHILHKHYNIFGEKQCKLCYRRFSCFVNLKTHMHSVHTKTRPFACSQCDLRFASRKQLMDHNDSKHPSEDIAWLCPHCPKSFSLKRYRDQHITRCHIKPYQCKVCSKRYRDYAHLQAHLYVHSGEKPFSCDVCSAKFRSRAILRKHVKCFHPSTKSKGGEPVTLNSSSIDLTTTSLKEQPAPIRILKPMTITKNTQLQRVKAMTFVCALCHKLFESITELKNHSQEVHYSANFGASTVKS